MNTVRIEGLRELERAFADMKKTTGKNVMRRVLRDVGTPIADTARALAPDDPETGGRDLRSSIGVGTKLSARQAGLHRKAGKATVEMFVGAGALPQAITQEFGTYFHGPQSFMRPAWERHKGDILPKLGGMLWDEIAKAARRAARKTARLRIRP